MLLIPYIVIIVIIVTIIFRIYLKKTNIRAYNTEGIIRHEIQNYSTVDSLRSETIVPTKNDKIFILENEGLYYYDWSDNTSEDNGTSCILQGIYRWKIINKLNNEDKICLNDTDFKPFDVNNPLTSEVNAWVIANLSGILQKNGTLLTYYINGSCDVPDFTWVLNDNEEITLIDKRTFNTKTVYVDAGSGSDITGKRGYRNSPFKTINGAIPFLQEDDLLYVFSGAYTSSIPIPVMANIFCEKGVDWEYSAPLTNNISVENPKTVEWEFDYLHSNNTNIHQTRTPNLLLNCRYGINLKINRAEYIFAWNNGNPKNFIKATWDIKYSYNSHFMPSGKDAVTSSDNGIHILNIDTCLKNTNTYGVGCQPFNNGIFSANINSLVFTSANGVDSNFLNRHTAGEQYTDNKSIKFNLNNVKTLSNTPLNTYPIFTNPIEAQVNINVFNNTLTKIMGLSNNDLVETNINGVFDIHTLALAGQYNKTNNIYKFSIKGVQNKGFVIYTTGNNTFGVNTIIQLDLDVITKDHAAIYIGLDSTIFGVGTKIIISGRIETKKPGYPCIILGNNQNNTIQLMNLTLINDGTVSPIMINSLTPESIGINNVKSNSLTVDANIAEIGESIVRNTSYK